MIDPILDIISPKHSILKTIFLLSGMRNCVSVEELMLFQSRSSFPKRKNAAKYAEYRSAKFRVQNVYTESWNFILERYMVIRPCSSPDTADNSFTFPNN